MVKKQAPKRPFSGWRLECGKYIIAIMEPQRTALTEWIMERILEQGPVTVAQSMEWALYHPQYGYYTKGPSIGPRGDFTTSPEASSEFGKMLAKHAADVDNLLDNPARFDLVEYGPGRGTLASDLLAELALRYPGLYSRIHYHLIEISPALVEQQRVRLLPAHAGRVEWKAALTGHDLCGAIIANEFVDAFPVHVLEAREGAICEQYVNVKDDDIALTYGPLSSPKLTEFLERHSLKLGEGDQVEINLAAADWIKTAANAFSRCVALIIDYGDVAPGRYSSARREGTLLGYYGGKVTHDILANPGEQDLTALVDFTALEYDAKSAGFDSVGMTRQAAFLIGLGLGSADTQDEEADLETALATRRGIQALVSMEGLGRFHVLVLSKGIDASGAAKGVSGLKYKDIL